MEIGVARLHDGTFLLREVAGELECDYVLRFSSPDGEQTWRHGWVGSVRSASTRG